MTRGQGLCFDPRWCSQTVMVADDRFEQTSIVGILTRDITKRIDKGCNTTEARRLSSKVTLCHIICSLANKLFINVQKI